MDKYRIRLTFTEPLLATSLFADLIPKGTEPSLKQGQEIVTHFPRTLDGPAIYDHDVWEFLRHACDLLHDTEPTGLLFEDYSEVFDGLVFVQPHRIPIYLPYDDEVVDEVGHLSRDRTIDTLDDELTVRVSSETAPAGSQVEFALGILGVPEAVVRKWLDYGQLYGLGQWPGAGYGTFTYTMEKIDQ